MQEKHPFVPISPQLNHFDAQPQGFVPLVSQQHGYSSHPPPVLAHQTFQDSHSTLQESDEATRNTAVLLNAQYQM